jgi:hypothetical protein
MTWPYVTLVVCGSVLLVGLPVSWATNRRRRELVERLLAGDVPPDDVLRRSWFAQSYTAWAAFAANGSAAIGMLVAIVALLNQ